MAGEQVTLDSLHQLITKMNENMETNMQSVRGEIADLGKKLSTVETNVDKKIEELKDTLEGKIAGVRDEIKTEVKSQVDTEVATLKKQVIDLQIRMQSAETELVRMKSLVDSPFPPDLSVVIYGLSTMEEETDTDAVNWLFSTVLGVTVGIDGVSRTKARDTNKLGVVKVRLSSVEDKIEVLRAKRKCDDNPDAENIIIKTCESHDARVGRLNNKLLLSKLPDGKDYTITGHGLIKLKSDTAPKQGEGGVGSDDAGLNDEVTPDTASGSLSDNGGARGDSDGQQPDQARSPKTTGGNNRGGRSSQSAQRKPKDPNSTEASRQNGKQGGRGGGSTSTRRSSRNQGNLRA